MNSKNRDHSRSVSALLVMTIALLTAAFANAEGAMLTCSVDAKREGGLLHLTAIAKSSSDANLDVGFATLKSGPSGTARNMQGGVRQVSANVPAVVGQVAIGISDSDVVEGHLTVTRGDEIAECRYP